MISKKLAKWIAYHPKTVLIVCLILIIPSIIGYFLTGVNYDILSYLPENLESVQGEQILDETFHNSASSFIIVKDTEPKDIQKLEDQIRQVEGVSNVIGATDIGCDDTERDSSRGSDQRLLFAGRQLNADNGSV